MANPNAKTDHLPKWQPGQSGNPSGKPKNLLTKDRVAKLMSEMSDFSPAELKDVVKGNNALKAMVAAIMLKAIETGDPSRLDFVLNRSVGKPKDTMEIERKDWSKEFEEAGEQNVLALLKKIDKERTGT